ncbi:retrovirus-related pol polyprotein from transposon TNT 1-94 [Tanacetum coccineum]|uniref:Retrovirus-related pol polyprotein from transposon TNT 1-94 n=1 Tax=Tanacetum coccineum TaxID=301880 RepID=A0ABQ5CIP2_9ASTR
MDSWFKDKSVVGNKLKQVGQNSTRWRNLPFLAYLGIPRSCFIANLFFIMDSDALVEVVPDIAYQTDNGTEFVNQTLRKYYKKVGISYETSVAHSPQQNGVVERRNQAVATNVTPKIVPSYLLQNPLNDSNNGYHLTQSTDKDHDEPLLGSTMLKLDDLGGYANEPKARYSGRGYHQEVGIDFEKSIPLDADHAGCQDTRRSTSGSMQLLGVGFKISHVARRWAVMFKLDTFVNTEYQLADIFTKALAKERIEFLINKLGMQSFTPETLKHLTDEVDDNTTQPHLLKASIFKKKTCLHNGNSIHRAMVILYAIAMAGFTLQHNWDSAYFLKVRVCALMC